MLSGTGLVPFVSFQTLSSKYQPNTIPSPSLACQLWEHPMPLDAQGPSWYALSVALGQWLAVHGSNETSVIE